MVPVRRFFCFFSGIPLILRKNAINKAIGSITPHLPLFTACRYFAILQRFMRKNPRFFLRNTIKQPFSDVGFFIFPVFERPYFHSFLMVLYTQIKGNNLIETTITTIKNHPEKI